MSEQSNNTVNFDENGEFSSLDDILLALNKSRYCYSACVALRAKKDKYSSDRTRIIEQLIREIEHTINQILLYSNKKLKNNGKVMQFNDYQSITDIGYLNDTLNYYGMQPEEIIILQNFLIEGLDNFIEYFPENHYLKTRIADLIYDSDYEFPSKYVYLLSDWKRVRYDWQQQGIDKQQVWQWLIEVEMIKNDVNLEQFENKYFDDDLLPALYESNNLVISDHKPESLVDVLMAMTEGFLDIEIRWVDEKEITLGSKESRIQLNGLVEPTATKTESWYFEYMGIYYQCVFDYTYTDYFASVIRIFNAFLRILKPDLAVYQLPTDQEPIFFFIANQKKFDALNKKLKIPVSQ
jgi:hypothetical protein